MRVAGLIVEYNPFHNGHLHHLQESVRLSKADYAVCVMSGHFLQRGEPALLDKWTRAAMAVSGGADLVFELPYAFSGRSAEYFATGAVDLLSATGIVTHICFGSETADLDVLKPISKILAEEPPLFQDLFKEASAKGLPFPSARQEALLEYLKTSAGEKTGGNLSLDKFRSCISEPNNILGIEYLKALIRKKSRIKPIAIPRIGPHYHEETFSKEKIASATAIRHHLEKTHNDSQTEGNLQQIESVMPKKSYEIMSDAIAKGRGPVFKENFASMILSQLRRLSPTEIASIVDIREGLENRLKNSARQAVSLEDLLDKTKTKRFPRTTLQRILFHVLADFRKEAAEIFENLKTPPYLRVLGFSKRGRRLLQTVNESAAIPIIQRPAPFMKPSANETVSSETIQMLGLDILTTDLYVLGFLNPQQRTGGQDYTHKIITH